MHDSPESASHARVNAARFAWAAALSAMHRQVEKVFMGDPADAKQLRQLGDAVDAARAVFEGAKADLDRRGER